MDENTDSKFLSVIRTWPEYYETMDEGLGTTYERFILHRYFEFINQNFDVNSVLEVPSFGMTGVSSINSLWWAHKKIKTVIVDTDMDRINKSIKVWNDIPLKSEFRFTDDLYDLPFKDAEFDVSWNFASIWFLKDLDKFIAELSRVTRKVIFICVPNRYGIGFILRKYLSKGTFNLIHFQNIRAGNLLNSHKKAGFKLQKSGYLDIPPWPDIAMKKEDMLKKIGLGFLVKKNDPLENHGERKCIVDFFSGKNPELEKDILKYSFLEKSPFPIKQVWGHHRYFIFARQDQI